MFHILVCDDDKEIVEAIEIYLSQEGYDVLKAYDGIEAMEILEEKEVNLLIIDVMMPRLDGIRATLKIREKNSLPIIILSAKSEDSAAVSTSTQPNLRSWRSRALLWLWSATARRRFISISAIRHSRPFS